MNECANLLGVLGGQKMFSFKKIAGLIMAAALYTTVPTVTSAEIFKGETAVTGGSVHTMFVAFANLARTVDIEIQVNAGQTLTKTMLKAAKGDLEFYSGVQSLMNFMRDGSEMYAKIEDAPELSQNLRAILGFMIGVYHPLVLESSGIETWKDLKGKSVFTGPPASAAAATSEKLIRIVTGYEAGTDYTAVRLSWGEGAQALTDNKIDALIMPADIGSASVAQFGLTGKFRILSIPKEFVEGGELSALVSGNPSLDFFEFDGDVYKGQMAKGTINAIGIYQFIGTRKGVSEEIVYNATKAFWENLETVHATAIFLKDVTRETAFVALNLPLHAGAIKYYDEAGFDIPEELR